MNGGMLRRQLPFVVLATMLVLGAFAVQGGFGAQSQGEWTSSLKTGDVVARGTVWRVTVTPTPDEVEFWASGRVIATDKTAPFETPLDLAPGNYKLGFCHEKDGVSKCETTETGEGTGIVARVQVVAPTSTSTPTPTPTPTPAPTPAPAPAPATTSGATAGTAATTSRDSVAPRQIRQVAVTAAGASSVTLQWRKSSDNVGVAGYGVYLNGRPKATTPDTRYSLTDLACGTGYTVGVDVYDSAGNRSATTTTTVSTSACPDRTAPGAPTAVKLAAATASSVLLVWQPSTDDRGVVSYGLYVGGLQVGSTSEAAATVSGLTCGRSYEVGIDAADAVGNRSVRTSAFFSTSPCPPDRTAPSQPNSLGVGTATATSITLSWAPATDNTGVSAYGLYRGSTRIGSTAGTTTVFDGLTCGTTYQLGVDAVDAAGNRSAISSMSASTGACAPASSGTWWSSLTTGDVVQRGTAWKVTVTPTPDAVEFWASGRVIATDTSAPFETPLDLTPGDYKLGFCHDKDGVTKCETVESGAGAGIVARVTVVDTSSGSTTRDTSAPTMPGSLRVVTAAPTSLSMTWSPSTDNMGVAGYGEYRGASRVATTTQTTATISGLACGTAYPLGVDAYDASGNQSPRADVTATTTACPDTDPPSPPTNVVIGTRTGTSIALSWAASSDNTGVVSYGLYQGGTLVASPSGAAGIVTGLSCGTTYTLGVDAVDAAGNRSEQALVMVATTACGDTQPPTAPTGLAASSVTQTSLTLRWAAATDNVGVSGYNIYRGGTLLGQTTTLTYPISGLTCGTSSTFTVESRDAAGNVSTSRASLTVATTACSPTPTGTGLQWAPPSLANPTTIDVTNQNREFYLDNNKDYIVKLPSTPLTAEGGLVLIGGHNVVIVGGEIRNDSPISGGQGVDMAYGIALYRQTGTVHIEGVWIHGAGIGQTILIAHTDQTSANSIIQVENSRLESLHPVGTVHTDTIQSYGGPGQLRLYNDTLISNGVTLQTQPCDVGNGPTPHNWDYRRLNLVHQTADAYALWKNCTPWSEYHQDLWLKVNPNHVAASSNSAWAGGNCWACWNPGGSWPITGEAIHLGTPPGGDFVPASSVGIGYVSPG
jgi:chitodextrinase